VIGESIGSYRIVAKLGEGGMGAVYLGEHKRIARRAAIKVLLPELSRDEQMIARFFNEARATSLIRHPGIVEVIDCDVLANGSAYIVMELLEGESLGRALRAGGRFPAGRARLIARHIAEALAAAHAQGIIHRDLKPDNVFLVAGGAGMEPIKILDFGIAKLIRTDFDVGNYRTRTGSLLGTPIYMSPEQCRGVGSIDHRTDIYALGCILFEMLCGRPPFTSEGFGELIQSHLSVTPPALRSMDPRLPEPLETLVARMLAKAPGDRPQTMTALIAELDALSDVDLEPASRPGTAPPVHGAPGVPPSGTAILAAPSTLGSASAERLISVADRDGLTSPQRRGAAPWKIVLAFTLLAGAGGTAWRVLNRPAPVAIKEPRPAVLPADPGPAAPAAPSPVVQSPHESSPAPAAQDVPPAPVPTPAEAGAHGVVSARKIKVVISSEPAAADVCRADDRALLGKTRLIWNVERGPRPVKLLIRKRGYRGQEIAVVPTHDASRTVTLDRLGPDDIDDVDNCRGE
jgi:serine/threonine-protein kinase